LKRYASLGVSLLAVLVVLGLMASPADARRHRHHRHHHRGSGPAGPVCGPGTVNIGGVCTAVPPAGPLGNANINISPSNVTMNLNGTFASSVVASGFPPSTLVVPNPPFVPCGNGSVIFIAPGGGAVADALGRAQFNIGEAGAAGCVPGTYPLVFTSGPGVSPFQSFVGFITLHF